MIIYILFCIFTVLFYCFFTIYKLNTHIPTRNYKAILFSRALPTLKNSPNGVSSQVDKKNPQYITPFDRSKSIERIISDIQKTYNTAITHIEKNDIGEVVYAHLIITTPIMRFKDDLELLKTDAEIVIRSQSRTGYSDTGLNRTRIEYIRNML